MKKYKKVRCAARKLREEGWALSAIGEKFGVGKSTVWYWVKDISVPKSSIETQRKNLAKGALGAQSYYARKRQEAYDEGWGMAPELLKDSFWRDFIVLYIGEGDKALSCSSAAVSNMDVRVIQFAYCALSKLSNKRVRVSVLYNPEDDIVSFRHYWATQLGLPFEDIQKRRKGYRGSTRRHRANYRGVARVGVPSVYTLEKIRALMDFVFAEWEQIK